MIVQCYTLIVNHTLHGVFLVQYLFTAGWILLSFMLNRFLSIVFIAVRTGLSIGMATIGVAMPGTPKRSRTK